MAFLGLTLFPSIGRFAAEVVINLSGSLREPEGFRDGVLSGTSALVPPPGLEPGWLLTDGF
jgi:hypothetical protein